MDGNKSLPSTSDSTDMLLRELSALQMDRSGGSSVGTSTGVMNSTDMGSGIPGSGDGSHNPTVSQLMQTLPPASSQPQAVALQGDDSFHPVYGSTVDVSVSTSPKSSSIPGSNKVKTNPIVNFDWPAQYYYGNMVAVHPHNSYLIAFAIKGKLGGNIRVIHRRTSQRCLLKGFKGTVMDISFAFSEDNYIAGIDDHGTTIVFKLTLTSAENSTIDESKVLEIVPRKMYVPERPQEVCRVIWCPYIPEDADVDSFDAKHLLAVVNGKKVEVWAVDHVAKKKGSGPISGDRVTQDFVDIKEHKADVVDGAFSPDGTALATASLSGEVQFFQIYVNEGSPKCLHKWSPHEGQPLSCLFFLDNYKNRDAPDSQFWRYAVTGCDRNQVLKIWSCVNWSCYQTLRFVPEPGRDGHLVDTYLKATLDMTAQYLLLCSYKTRMLYILQVHQDATAAHFSSISEFLLAKPCYSLAVLEAINRRPTASPSEAHLDDITTGELDDDDDEMMDDNDAEVDTRKSRIQIRLIAVQNKALQEMMIRFEVQSSVAHPAASVSSLSTDHELRDGLTDVSMGGAGDSGPDASFSMADSSLGPEGDRLAGSVASSGQPAALGDTASSTATNILDRENSPALLTPDAFSRKQPLPGLLPNGAGASGVLRGSGSSTSSFTAVTALPDDSYVSPRSSGDPSILSPASSKVVSEHLVSPVARATAPPKGPDTTPTSVPLPPVTSQEEEELVSSRSSGASSHQSGGGVQQQQGSPASSLPQPPSSFYFSQAGGAKAEAGSREAAEEGAPPQPRRSQRSSDGHDPYDDEDEEVAKVLEGSGCSSSEKLSGTGLFQQQEEEEEEEEDVGEAEEVEEEIEEEIEEAMEEEGEPEVEEEEEEEEEASTSWPHPPSVDRQDHFKGNGPRALNDESEAEGLDGNEDDGEDDDLGEEAMEEKSTRTKVIVREIVDRTALYQVRETLGSLQGAVVQQSDVLASLQQQLQQQQQNSELMAQQLQELHAQREQLLEAAQLAQAPPPPPQQGEGEGQAAATLLPRIEAMLGARMQGETQRVQNELAKMRSSSKQEMERLHNSVAQTITGRVNSAVATSVRSEMKNLMTPSVNECLAPLRERMSQDMQRSIQANENVIKDAIKQIPRNKATVDAISAAVSSAVPGPLQSAFSELFQSQVIPAFQQSTTNMFQQINDCFQRGTREYQLVLEKHLDVMRRQHQERQDPAVAALQSSVAGLQASLETLPQSLAQQLASQLQLQLQALGASLQADLATRLRSVVREEVAVLAREQEASLQGQLAIARSNAATPVPSSAAAVNPTVLLSRLRSLVQQGEIMEAFQTALNAANLEVLTGLCEIVRPDDVFKGHQPMSLPVVLSFIHQLCSRLSSKTELKMMYLEEAVMALKDHEEVKRETVLREHVQNTMSHLVRQLNAFLTKYPREAGPHSRTARLLIFIAESLSVPPA